MNCPKCGSDCTVEVIPSKNEGRWRIKYECIKADCHLRSWLMAEEAEKAPVESSKGMVFSRNRALKCEICNGFTDILHPFKIEGDGDYLMCGACKESFSEAERLCGLISKGQSFLP